MTPSPTRTIPSEVPAPFVLLGLLYVLLGIPLLAGVLWLTERRPVHPDEYYAQIASAAAFVCVSALVLLAAVRRGEYRLRSRERFWHSLVEQSQEGVWVGDEVAHTTFVNKRFTDMLGYRASELTGTSIFDLVSAEVRTAGEQLVGAPPGSSAHIEGAVRRKDGSWMRALVSAAPLHDSNGTHTGGMALITDIGPLKAAQQKLQALADGQREVARIADELIALSDLDEICRRAVELMRERLGVERCAIFLHEDGAMRGTFGTDRTGQTTDERDLRTELNDDWRHLLRPREESDPQWDVLELPHVAWRDHALQVEGSGWVAATPLRTVGHVLGVLFNDASLTGTPPDEMRQGLLALLCGFLGQIMARTYAEAAQARSEAIYRRTITTARGVPYRLKLGSCELEFAGEGLEELLGMSPDAATLRAFDNCVLEAQVIGPEPYADESSYRRAFVQGVVPEFRTDYRIELPDGRERWVSACATLVTSDRTGEPTGVQGILQDVTDRRRLANRLQLTVRVLELLNRHGDHTETIREILVLIKRHTGVEAVGLRLKEGDDFPYYLVDGFPDQFVREEMSLCPRGEGGAILRDESGEPLLDCICGAVLGGHADACLPGFMQGGSFWTNDSAKLAEAAPSLPSTFHLRGRCLLEGYVSLAAVPLISEGEIVGMMHLADRRPGRFRPERIAFLEDVAHSLAIALQRRQAEEDLRESRDELEDRVRERTAELEARSSEMEAFTYTVAHDLRAPLRAMQGFAQVLSEDYGSVLDEFGRDYTRRISGAATRMDDLICDLLAYSHLGTQGLTSSDLSLDEVVQTALAGLQPTIQECQARVQVQPDLPAVRANASILCQVIESLISNALKFTEPRVAPEVSIRAEFAQDRVRLWVDDNGIGVAPEHQERIFGVFERLHAAETHPGTGIGLAIVQRGMGRMGGTSGVVSTPGVGSSFWVELPAKGSSE